MVPLSLLILALSHSFLYVAASFPSVDFDRMGSVGFAGAFSGFGFFDNTSSLELDPTSSTLFSRNTDGSFTKIASTDIGGRINTGCAIQDSFFVGGNFSTLDGQGVSNIALYKTSTGTITPLPGNGPNAEVLASYCDEERSLLWLGGSFTSPHAAVTLWNIKSQTWDSAQVNGLGGPNSVVRSIAPNASATGLLFGGSFFTNVNNSANITSVNNPNVPYSSGASPYSSSLVPVPLQNAQIDASPSSTDPRFDNIHQILCPAGADGPGNSWFAADGGVPVIINIRTFMSLNAVGLRLGNTFQANHGTTEFSVVSIPDNSPLTLKYLDPATGQNQTCVQPCPLSTNSSILYQDYIFDRPRDITGLQIQISSFTGSSAGLHLLQLLSSGAFASSVASQNGRSCYAPNPSNISLTGVWTEKSANTDIPGTVQTTLVTTVAVGTPSANAPSISWRPYVSATGQYQIRMLIPGCTAFQDCDLRTTVKVVVFPGGGQDPVVTTVSQQNTDDASVSIYTGSIVPTSSQFETTVTMTLSDRPEGQGQDGEFELVADRIQIVLLTANTSSISTTNNTGIGGDNASAGFGVLEYPFADVNSSTTPLNQIGSTLLPALGGASAVTTNQPRINTVVQHQSGITFIAGDFNLNTGAEEASHIVAYLNGSLKSLAQGGLNGPVLAMQLLGDLLYVGGNFTNTAKGVSTGLLFVAAYDVIHDQWQSLETGVSGPVSSIGIAESQIQIGGNFTSLNAYGDLNISTAGLVTWDTNSLTWLTNTASLVGTLSLVSNSSSNQQNGVLFVAGNVQSYETFGASGALSVKNGVSRPQVNSLNISLGVPSSASAQLSARQFKEATHHTTRWAMHSENFGQRLSRQLSQPSPLPNNELPLAPAVLAGAFWTNASSSEEVVLLGGNFSFNFKGQLYAAMALYHPSTLSLSPPTGSQISGTVLSLLVVENLAFIGGEFEVNGTGISQFAVYDLGSNTWQSVMNVFGPINGSSAVRSITNPPSLSNKVIVAGSFAGNGTNECQSICAWDYSTHQWSSLGAGIQGQVSSIGYGGDSRDTIIVAGSLLVQGTPADVAQFTISNSSWAVIGNIGDLAGPVTALEVNNGNLSSIFVAGRSMDGTSSYLSNWNGQKWTRLISDSFGVSEIAQLKMVPLQDSHSANGVIEQDRMLLISGTLIGSSFGKASSALFDGSVITPYIMSMTASGTPGYVSSLFNSLTVFSFAQQSFLATGIVILISIAIAAGVVFFLALIGILVTLFSRRDDTIGKYEGSDDEDDDSTRHRPSSLLEHINAATRTTILGAAPFVFGNEPYDDDRGKSDTDPFAKGVAAPQETEHEVSPTQETVEADREPSKSARVRYSFDGAEEGELALVAGTEIDVLDDKDPAWWYARDQNGREGVVPAAYLY